MWLQSTAGINVWTIKPSSNMGKLDTLEVGSCKKKIWPIPEVVVTVLCTPDDGCGWHPEHVKWTCRIINRLLCVGSHWKIVNIIFSAFTLSFSLEVKPYRLSGRSVCILTQTLRFHRIQAQVYNQYHFKVDTGRLHSTIFDARCSTISSSCSRS